MPSKEFIERMKDRLLEEKENFKEELEDLKTGSTFGDEEDRDEDEEALRTEAQEVSGDLIKQLESEISRIDAALQRIEDGTYGISTVSGKEITEARLEVLPWAETNTDEEGEDSHFVA